MCYEKYIFLDESGDLGVSDNSSKFFVITLLITSDKKSIENKLKKYKAKLIRKKKFQKLNEIKANNSDDEVRFQVLNIINSSEVEIYAIIVNKITFYNKSYNKKFKLYNYLTNIIIAESNLNGKKVHLIIDKRIQNKTLLEEFNNQIKSKNSKINLEISHYDSYSLNGLQLVDFISWSIFRYYEYKDNRFVDYIKSKIILKKEV